MHIPLLLAELAFLSACQTATGAKRLPEEAVHLTAGMLLAGYCGVIATMWSIKDNDAPFVADEVYAYLFKDQRLEPKRAAHALHHAVQKLRKDKGVPFLSWVPFIHVGI
jgi:CHAT domain-containing protein